MTAEQLSELRTLATDNPTIAAAVKVIDSLPKWADGGPIYDMPCRAWFCSGRREVLFSVIYSSRDVDDICHFYGNAPLYRTEYEVRAAMEAAR